MTKTTLRRHRPDEALIPVVRPTGVNATPLGCKPGTSARVLRELRADDSRRRVPVSALRRVDVTRVRLDPPADIDENVTAILAAIESAPFAKHEDALAMVLGPVAALLNFPVEVFWYDNRSDALSGIHADAVEQLLAEVTA